MVSLRDFPLKEAAASKATRNRELGTKRFGVTKTTNFRCQIVQCGLAEDSTGAEG